MIDSKL